MAASVPVSITRTDEGLSLEWNDRRDRVWYAARSLRLACPCAQCVDEMSGRPLLDPASVPLDVRPLHVALVGSYGIRVQWSDGHGTGIYTFTWLRSQSAPAPASA